MPMAPAMIAVLARLFVATVSDPVDDWEEEPPAPVPGVAIEGRAVASLVEVDTLTVEVTRPDEADDTDSTLRVACELAHDLDAKVLTAELAVVVMPEGDFDFVWTRLNSPPLALRTALLKQRLPHPVAVTIATAPEEAWPRQTTRSFTAKEVVGEIALQPAGLRYLATLQNVTLESPSVRDATRILEGGSPAELAGLARWATDAADDQPFDDAACRTLMGAIDDTVRRMRAPPAFGDYQRLSAAAAIAVICAGPADLERALSLQRPITILMSSAELSHNNALAEELAIGIEIHALGPTHSRSASALAWEVMLGRLRVSALDRLLRLAAEPADFRGVAVPPTRSAPLRVPAIALLSPLAATEVDRVLSLASERPETQREILRFYTDMHHAPVIEPLVDWLTGHPVYLDDLGTYAVTHFGAEMLGVLVRRFDDPDATLEQRAAMWRLLAMLPDEHAGRLLAMVGTMGVDVSGLSAAPTIADVLQRLMEHERQLEHERTERLVELITDVASTDSMAKVRASKRLTEVAPTRAADIADAIITAHVTAARSLEADAAAERRAVLTQLAELPLGEATRAAVRASVVTDAELALGRGELDVVFELLERHDPALADTSARTMYENALRTRWQQSMAARDWTSAEATIAKADQLLADVIDTAQWQARLDQQRSLPLRIVFWMVVGALTVLAFYALHALGLTAAIRRRIAERDARRAELSRQWEPDVVDPAEAAVVSSGDDEPSEQHNEAEERVHSGVTDDGEAIADSWSAPSNDEVDGSPLDVFAA